MISVYPLLTEARFQVTEAMHKRNAGGTELHFILTSRPSAAEIQRASMT